MFSVNPGVNFTVNNLTIANGYPGIHNDGSTLTVTNSTFTGNGGYQGGGISNDSGLLTVTNSTFTGNSADWAGAGISNDSGLLTVTNSTFTGNRACIATRPTSGGGISSGGPLTVTNSTFTGNGAFSGGGIAGGRESLLRDTIVANNSGGNCSGSITDGGHNLDDGTSCGFSPANGSLSSTDPQLDPAGLQDNGGPTETVALCTGVGEPTGCTAASPAIDAGDQAVCAAAPVSNLDQRGFVRPGTGHANCSIGAYEADGTAPEATPTPTETPTLVATPTQTPTISACIGDCAGRSSVAINDLITLVNIVLGNAQASECPNGIPNGAAVDIALLVQAVNSALNGCGC